MHILFYSTASLFESRFLLLLDEAMCHEKAGHQVTFVYCDGCLRHCRSNISGSGIVCAVCRHLSEKACRQLPKTIAVHPLSQFLLPSDVEEIDKTHFRFTSTRELQSIDFRSTDIGYAVLSHYIGMKRNLTPVLTPALIHLFNNHLRAAARLTAATEQIVATCRADCYALFNGRLFDTRGFMRETVRAGQSECRCYELESDPSTWEKRKIFFKNALPHSIAENARLIRACWDKALQQDTLGHLMSAGAQFFERRKNNQTTNISIIFTTNQVRGALPDQWSSKERNFVFFNSSEDEFASIDREFDQYKYLPTQVEVIRKVAALAQQADTAIHLYLRIHPNLAKVDFDYHHELMRLDRDFSNLTVIPADSPISTYTLIEQAEKVVVVGSTVGIEAVYENKPVILLGPAMYRLLGACYTPKDDDELCQLLKERLAQKDRMTAIKYGFYMMSTKGERWQYYDFSTSKKRALGIKLPYANCYTLLGSSVLFGLAYKLITSLLFIPYHLKRSSMRRLGMSG